MNVNEEALTVNQTTIKADAPILVALEKRLSSYILLRFMLGVLLFWFSSGLDSNGWFQFSRILAVVGIALAAWGLIWFVRLTLDKRKLANQTSVEWSEIPAFAAMRRRCGW